MARRLVAHGRAQQITSDVFITLPDTHLRQTKPAISVRRVADNTVKHPKYYEEYLVVDKVKEAQTGRWILNVIAAKEAYERERRTRRKKKSSRVEPIEKSSTQSLQGGMIFSTTTIDDDRSTHLSSFSSASSVDDIRTTSRSTVFVDSRSGEYSTDQFNESVEAPCLSQRMLIILSIVCFLIVAGIIIAVFVTIFVGKNQSTNTNSSNANSKSLKFSAASRSDPMGSVRIFNLNDTLCEGRVPYKYYTSSQLATSTSYTIQFTLPDDALSGHWYLDDITVVQNSGLPLLINGGFESNLTGWIWNSSLNSASEIYVNTINGSAHTGSAYLYGASANASSSIEQTFSVVLGEYINVSFWWGYDGRVTYGHRCQSIGQLIPIEKQNAYTKLLFSGKTD